MQPRDLQYFDPYGEIDRKKNRLPHWHQEGRAYFVTFRLADALPHQLLSQWDEERILWLRHHPEPWSVTVEKEHNERFTGRLEKTLDEGHGSCVLRQTDCATCVAAVLAHFEGSRTTLLASIVMPNHVHVLFVLHKPWALERIIASWKRVSAINVNRLLGREGALWQRDYFDRLIRDEEHLGNCVRYIRRNPVKARLRSGEYLLWESDLAREIE